VNGWGKRHRTVYGYQVTDLRDPGWPIAWGYVGKTSSNPRYRDAQHRNGKVWAWAIKGQMQILWSGECGRISLWFREVYWIHRCKPLFNVDHNRHNPNRITPYDARRVYGMWPSGVTSRPT
jgi:hypothetical protein